MDITLAEGEKVELSVHPRRRSDGRAGTFAGLIVWSASVAGDGSGIVIDVAGDRLSAIIHGKTAGAAASISLSATKLNGIEISETHAVTVTPPPADDFGTELGEIVPEETN